MLLISQVDEVVRRQRLVVEQLLEHLAHMSASGDMQINGQLGRVFPTPAAVHQHQLVDHVGKLQAKAAAIQPPSEPPIKVARSMSSVRKKCSSTSTKPAME